MVVRVQIRAETVKTWAAWLLKAAATVCFVVGVWILSAGLRWAGAFVVERGLFSHWQVWMACGVAAQLAAFRLNRRNRQLLS